jgi:hypothetical protein
MNRRRYVFSKGLTRRKRGENEQPVMIQNIERETIVEMLLNSLEVERYVRGPLLQNVLDELSVDPRLSAAADLARSLLDRVDDVEPAEWSRTIRELRLMVRESAPRSGVRAVRFSPSSSSSSSAPIAGAA